MENNSANQIKKKVKWVHVSLQAFSDCLVTEQTSYLVVQWVENESPHGLSWHFRRAPGFLSTKFSAKKK